MVRAHPKTLEVNGTRLHYVEEGQGEAVVFVHGGLGDLRTWRPQMEPFSRRYHVVSYSRRGHYPNASAHDITASPMAPHLDDLAGLIEKLDLAPAHLVGNSYGAYICLAMACRRPELVRTLTLAEPPIHPLLTRLPGGAPLFEEFVVKAWRPAREAFARGSMEEGVRLFLDGAVGKNTFEKLPHRVREETMKDAPELAAAAMTPFEEHMLDFTCQDAARVEAPTLLLHGARSPHMYFLINDELARCLPHAEQAEIPGAAHVLHNQNPEAHNKIVLDFLARHSE